jgi:GT2 family glycosyltransferase
MDTCLAAGAALPESPDRQIRVAVIVASVNRSEEIGDLLRHLARQTLQPSAIILSVEQPSDLPEAVDPRVQIITGPKGLTKQRNRALQLALGQSDLIVFFDDDFAPADDALEGVVRLFHEHHDIAGATGHVFRDGVVSGGLTDQEAAAILEQEKNRFRPELNTDTDALYGCNMALRAACVGDIRFDETLPLYAWQEDVDFAGQLRAKGRIIKSTAFCGVHRGVQKSRTSGIPLGFSQIVNPIYLVRKGTMRPMKAAKLMARNLIANHVKAVSPEKFVDRAGRMRGNWLGICHIMTGKADPAAVLRLGKRRTLTSTAK